MREGTSGRLWEYVIASFFERQAIELSGSVLRELATVLSSFCNDTGVSWGWPVFPGLLHCPWRNDGW
jgi:hypothetical protein